MGIRKVIEWGELIKLNPKDMFWKYIYRCSPFLTLL